MANIVWKIWALTLITAMSLENTLSFASLAKCTPLDQCSCKIENSGEIISLQELDSKSSPRFSNVPDAEHAQYHYFYSPCTPIIYKDFKNILIYQVADTGVSFNLGKPTLDVKVDVLNNVYQFTYVGKNKDNQDRQTVVNLKCSKTSTTAVLSSAEEGPQFTYNFFLTTRCACPGNCRYDPDYYKPKINSKDNHGLSVGSILCIVLLVVVILYLMVGILLNKYGMNKTGLETIPNWSFWKDFPALVKDGISFVFTYLKNGPCSKTQYQQID